MHFYIVTMDADMLNITMSLLILFMSLIFGVFTAVGHLLRLETPVKVEAVQEDVQEAVQEDVQEEAEVVPPATDVEEEEITKSDMDYLKAQLAFYREEKSVCEAKIRQLLNSDTMKEPMRAIIPVDNYTALKKYWDGLNTMIAELEEIIE